MTVSLFALTPNVFFNFVMAAVSQAYIMKKRASLIRFFFLLHGSVV